MKWHYYVLAVVNAFNYIFTFLALWYTMPFTNKLSDIGTCQYLY